MDELLRHNDLPFGSDDHNDAETANHTWKEKLTAAAGKVRSAVAKHPVSPLLYVVVLAIAAGILLGQGKTIAQAMEEMNGAVVEGYYAAASAMELAGRTGVEMPITTGAYQVLYEGKDPRCVLRELMARDKRGELENETSWI